MSLISIIILGLQLEFIFQVFECTNGTDDTFFTATFPFDSFDGFEVKVEVFDGDDDSEEPIGHFIERLNILSSEGTTSTSKIWHQLNMVLCIPNNSSRRPPRVLMELKEVK
jgi:hypothetical protein